MWAAHWNLICAAADNVSRNCRGYLVAASGLVLPLVLLLSGIAISEGIKIEALASVQTGADVYCTWNMFGRDAPVPSDEIPRLEQLNGVIRAVPRIIGRVRLADEIALVIGVPLEALAGQAIAVRGSVPDAEDEVLVGHELARLVGLAPGMTIALESDSIRLFTISGVVSSTSSLWSAKAIVCDRNEAAIVFGDHEHVSDVGLYTRPGYQDLVAEAATRLNPRFRVQTKDLVSQYVLNGMTVREGVFTALYALAMGLAIASFAVMTYLGQTPRRKEIGLLKAEGWSTANVMEMVAWENLIVSLAAASGALLSAFLWVKVLGAPLIAPFFLAELPRFPEMTIPSRFTPLPPLLALLFCVVVTMTGSLYATWRTSITRPAEVLR